MGKTKYTPLSAQKSAPTAEQIRQLVEEEAIGGNKDLKYQTAVARTRDVSINRFATCTAWTSILTETKGFDPPAWLWNPGSEDCHARELVPSQPVSYEDHLPI